VFPKDMVCLRNISVDTLHKGDTEDDNDDDDDDYYYYYYYYYYIVVNFIYMCRLSLFLTLVKCYNYFKQNLSLNSIFLDVFYSSPLPTLSPMDKAGTDIATWCFIWQP
jgi:hypothetical protein